MMIATINGGGLVTTRFNKLTISNSIRPTKHLILDSDNRSPVVAFGKQLTPNRVRRMTMFIVTEPDGSQPAEFETLDAALAYARNLWPTMLMPFAAGSKDEEEARSGLLPWPNWQGGTFEHLYRNDGAGTSRCGNLLFK
jgi:hypothetical protein